MEETAVDLLLASKEGGPHAGWGAREHCSPARPRLDSLSCPQTLRKSREVPQTPASCGAQPSRTRLRGWCASRVGRQQWECSCKTLF